MEEYFLFIERKMSIYGIIVYEYRVFILYDKLMMESSGNIPFQTFLKISF